jgi:hypothetical protein
MPNFFDQIGGLWVSGGLLGKAAGFVAAPAREAASPPFSLSSRRSYTHGMIYVGLPYTYPELTKIDEVRVTRRTARRRVKWSPHFRLILHLMAVKGQGRSTGHEVVEW